MGLDRIEYLKQVIKRTYKRYTGERTDGDATLLDVANFFNIPIDKSRIEDYVVKTIDYDIPSIEISDEKNDISYTAYYTDKAKIDKIDFCGTKEFNRVVSTSPIRKEEILYYIGSETPIITKMTFTDGDYELTFIRERSYLILGNDGIKMIVKYSQNVTYDGKNVKQPLFTRIYKNNYKNEDFVKTFEHEYTYGPDHFIKWEDSQDKYTYVKNNSVIYGINELKQKGLCHYFRGICFESTGSILVSEFLPFNMKEEDYPELSNYEMYQAGIVFQGGTGNGIHHTFTIYKSKNANEDIYLKYEAIKWDNFKKENGEPDCRKIVVDHKETQYPGIYPGIDKGKIRSIEIRNIIEMLITEFENNAFIQLVINELKTFSIKIDIRKGFDDEESDLLSPKVLIGKSFDKICALVNENRDDCFRLIREKFEKAANINGTPEKEQLKTLEPNSTQSSEN